MGYVLLFVGGVGNDANSHRGHRPSSIKLTTPLQHLHTPVWPLTRPTLPKKWKLTITYLCFFSSITLLPKPLVFKVPPCFAAEATQEVVTTEHEIEYEKYL